ncbi:MAG: hypothetical protein LBV41_11150 [Cytophagaceae bacterium]|jgi:transcription termination factor NusB|nr:hypothetical protein [Cytophagaceae bacterium]
MTDQRPELNRNIPLNDFNDSDIVKVIRGLRRLARLNAVERAYIVPVVYELIQKRRTNP